MNTVIFLPIWKLLFSSEGLLSRFEWFVKLDPDTIFFPEKLEGILKACLKNNRNCDPKTTRLRVGPVILGPMEVVSTSAARDYGKRSKEVCEKKVDPREDLYIEFCFNDLGSSAINGVRRFLILDPPHFSEQDVLKLQSSTNKNEKWCRPHDKKCFSRALMHDLIALHPFKDEMAFRATRDALAEFHRVEADKAANGGEGALKSDYSRSRIWMKKQQAFPEELRTMKIVVIKPDPLMKEPLSIK